VWGGSIDVACKSHERTRIDLLPEKVGQITQMVVGYMAQQLATLACLMLWSKESR